MFLQIPPDFFLIFICFYRLFFIACFLRNFNVNDVLSGSKLSFMSGVPRHHLSEDLYSPSCGYSGYPQKLSSDLPHFQSCCMPIAIFILLHPKNDNTAITVGKGRISIPLSCSAARLLLSLPPCGYLLCRNQNLQDETIPT